MFQFREQSLAQGGLTPPVPRKEDPMSHRRFVSPALPASLALLALLACRSTDKGSATGASITKAADQIELGIQQLDQTVAALHAMADTPATDLTAQRKTFEKALASLESTAEDVRETAAVMKAKGKEYFTQWEQQLASIQNEDIRERSAERRKAIEAGFSSLQTEYGEAKTAFGPLLDNLRDIRTVLKADTTMDGIEAMKPVVKQVDKDAKSVSKELTDLVERFRALGLKLSRVGPAPKPPEEKK